MPFFSKKSSKTTRISKANLKLIEGALEIQGNEPDELAFMARQLVQVTLPHAKPGQDTHLVTHQLTPRCLVGTFLVDQKNWVGLTH